MPKNFQINSDIKSITKRDLTYWNRVADNYDIVLTNRRTAEEGSIDYEEYEEEYVEKTIDHISKKGNIVLIEFGCGTGRFLKKYAHDKRIKLIIGIDFSDKMINCLFKNLECCKDLIGKKIIIVQNLAERALISLSEIEELNESIPIVLCMFNTLGNIELEDRRICVLENMKAIIEKKGIGIISVFNQERMHKDVSGTSECENYYKDMRVKKLIVPPSFGKRITMVIKNKLGVENEIEMQGDPIIFDKELGDVRTTDFYSHWFSKSELQKIILKSGLNVITIEEGIKMNNYKAKRGLIAKVEGGNK